MNTSRSIASGTLALVIGATLCQSLWAAPARTTYKWVDDTGHVTYGDHPPVGATTQAIRVSTGTPSNLPATTTADEGVEQPTTVAAAAPDKSSLSPEQASALCERARSNLEVLESHALIRQADANGEVHILDESSKQVQIATARDIIKAHCH